MKNSLTTILIVLLTGFSLALSAQANQDSTRHEVLKGETKYGISKQYDISIEQLERFNPQITEGLKVGMILLIPKNLAGKGEQDEHVLHTVKEGQTLYRLSKIYGVPVAAIQKANPDIRKDGLKVGAQLRIPVEQENEAEQEQASGIPFDTANFTIHQVDKGETAFSLSQRYEISLDSLYLLNPTAENGLYIGQILKFPKRESPEPKESAPQVVETPDTSKPKEQLASDEPKSTPRDTSRRDSDFFLYKVKTGDSFYALKRRYGVTQEELVKLNPELSGGLEVNQYIIVPKKEENEELGWLAKLLRKTEDDKEIGSPSRKDKSLKEKLNKPREKAVAIEKSPEPIEDTLTIDTARVFRVCLMLPFFAPDYNRDSLTMQSRVPARSQIALDFYNGFMLAVDSLTAEGMKMDLKVVDTRNDQQLIKNKLELIKQNEYDLVFGPLFKKNVELVADELREKEITVISPLSSTVDVNGRPNLVKVVPDQSAKELLIAQTLNSRYDSARVIFVHKGRVEDRQSVVQIKSRLASRGERAFIDDVILTEEMLKENTLKDVVAGKEDEVFVLLSDDKIFISDMINKLQPLRKDTNGNLNVVSTEDLAQLPTLSSEDLSSLELTMTKASFIDYTSARTNRFLELYREKYSDEPGRFAFQGFDVGIYFLNQLRTKGRYLMESLPSSQLSEAINTGFAWKKLENGGMENKYLFLTGYRNMQLVLLSETKREMME